MVEEPLGEASLWIPVYEGTGSADYNTAVVRNNKTGAAVRFQGDAPITKYIFWAVERAACPEPFIHIDLVPGQVQEWTSHYTSLADGEPIR